MKYVLDSSVGIKCLLRESESDKAIRVRDDFIGGLHLLLSPDVYPVEVAQAITRAERQLRITPAEGTSHFKTMLSIMPILHTYLPLLPRAYEISSQTRQGVYDCRYVALAERENCELLTADQKLINDLQPLFPFITSLASLP
jgi:predicted nucleic acid-binding protein